MCTPVIQTTRSQHHQHQNKSLRQPRHRQLCATINPNASTTKIIDLQTISKILSDDQNHRPKNYDDHQNHRSKNHKHDDHKNSLFAKTMCPTSVIRAADCRKLSQVLAANVVLGHPWPSAPPPAYAGRTASLARPLASVPPPPACRRLCSRIQGGGMAFGHFDSHLPE